MQIQQRLSKSHIFVLGLVLVLCLLDHLDNFIPNDRVLAFGPPVCDLRQACLAEVLVEHRRLALVGREEREQILDTTLAEGASEMIHAVVGEIGAEDGRQYADGRIALDEMIACKALEAGGRRETLADQQAGGNGELVALRRGPFINVLEKRRSNSIAGDCRPWIYIGNTLLMYAYAADPSTGSLTV